MPTYAVGQRLTAAMMQELSNLIDSSTTSTLVTSDSGTVTTTETTAFSLVVAVVSGRVYALESFARLTSSVAGDDAATRIRLTNSTGTELQCAQTRIATTNANGFPSICMTEWTASSTGNQTFVVTLVRIAGSGNIIARGAGVQPALLSVRLKG